MIHNIKAYAEKLGIEITDSQLQKLALFAVKEACNNARYELLRSNWDSLEQKCEDEEIDNIIWKVSEYFSVDSDEELFDEDYYEEDDL